MRITGARIPAVPLLWLLSCAHAPSADLKMRFVFDRDPPPSPPLKIDKDEAICGERLADSSLLVDPVTKGIANVAVYLYTRRHEVKSLDLPPPEERDVVLTARKCQYHPRVIVARAGDTLVYHEHDDGIHNLNISFFRNPAPGIVGGRDQRLLLRYSEPAPLPVQCNIHPWMKAYLILLDHRFVGVSDVDGFVTIKNLPSGKELVFRAWHERFNFQQADVAVVDCDLKTGHAVWEHEQWKLNKFRRTLSPEENDLESILVSSKHLRKKSD